MCVSVCLSLHPSPSLWMRCPLNPHWLAGPLLWLRLCKKGLDLGVWHRSFVGVLVHLVHPQDWGGRKGSPTPGRLPLVTIHTPISHKEGDPWYPAMPEQTRGSAAAVVIIEASDSYWPPARYCIFPIWSWSQPSETETMIIPRVSKPSDVPSVNIAVYVSTYTRGKSSFLP